MKSTKALDDRIIKLISQDYTCLYLSVLTLTPPPTLVNSLPIYQLTFSAVIINLRIEKALCTLAALLRFCYPYYVILSSLALLTPVYYLWIYLLVYYYIVNMFGILS